MVRKDSLGARAANSRPKAILGLLFIASCLPVKAAALALPNPTVAAMAAPALSCPVVQTEPGQRFEARSLETSITKRSAILGGTPSALDLIREQQAGASLATDLPINVEIESRSPVLGNENCLAMAPIVLPMMAPEPIVPQIADTFLGAARVRINRTPFTQDWRRVSRAALSASQVTNLIAGVPDSETETLSRVNSWVNQNIAPVDDAQFRRANDHWATAPETLSARAGDCEDYAILKYQMLAALGFNRDDMYLTLARDLVRNADHAVLIVRVQGRHYMLDNGTDALIPADQSHDYRPTMSFNSESGWIHGYVNGPRNVRRTLALR